jgi:hypothetical protein
MANDIAAEIEKEYGEFKFTDPVITFGYNKIGFQQKLNIFGKAFLILCVLFPVTFLLFYDLPAPTIFTISFSIVNILVFYEYHRRWDVVTIDFIKKEITIVSEFFFINVVRKFFSARTIILFGNIAYFNVDDGKRIYYFTDRLSLSMRRTTLYVKPAHKQEIALVNFRFERDARRLGELLQYYAVGRGVQLTG